MIRVALILVGLISALHFYIAYIEIFAWEARGPKVFVSFPDELFGQTIVLAANQGLYNAFLAIGLAWSLFIQNMKWQVNVATCFLIFVAVAGIFAAATISTKILFVQTVPALLALMLLLKSNRRSGTD